eukprot:ANDGO_08481.mRNA.1 hypothetical protein
MLTRDVLSSHAEQLGDSGYLSAPNEPYKAFGGHPVDDHRLLAGVSKHIKLKNAKQNGRNRSKSMLSDYLPISPSVGNEQREREESGSPTVENTRLEMPLDKSSIKAGFRSTSQLSTGTKKRSIPMVESLKTSTLDTTNLTFFMEAPPFGCELERRKVVFPQNAIHESTKKLGLVKKGFTFMENVERDIVLEELLPRMPLKQVTATRPNILATVGYVNKAVGIFKRKQSQGADPSKRPAQPAVDSKNTQKKPGGLLKIMQNSLGSGGSPPPAGNSSPTTPHVEVSGEFKPRADAVIEQIHKEVEEIQDPNMTKIRRTALKWELIFEKLRKNPAGDSEKSLSPGSTQDGNDGFAFRNSSLMIGRRSSIAVDTSASSSFGRSSSSLGGPSDDLKKSSSFLRGTAALITLSRSQSSLSGSISKSKKKSSDSRPWFMTEVGETSGSDSDLDTDTDPATDPEAELKSKSRPLTAMSTTDGEPVSLESTFPSIREMRKEISRRRHMMPYDLQASLQRARLRNETSELLAMREQQFSECCHSVARLSMIVKDAERHGRIYAHIRRLPMQKVPLWQRMSKLQRQQIEKMERVCTFWARFLEWADHARLPTVMRLHDFCNSLRLKLCQQDSEMNKDLLLWCMDSGGVDTVENRESYKVLQFVRKECNVNEYELILEIERRGWRLPMELKSKKRALRYQFGRVDKVEKPGVDSPPSPTNLSSSAAALRMSPVAARSGDLSLLNPRQRSLSNSSLASMNPPFSASKTFVPIS